MKKFVKILGDVAVAVGCCIGVGFLSGKEIEVFFGNKLNVAFFAVAFFIVTYTMREYCRKHSCDSVYSLSQSMFGRRAAIFNVVIALCSFVCITTVLAGVEQCLSTLFYLNKLPLYAFASAVIATLLLKRGLKALKIANVISILLAIILLIILLCKKDSANVEYLQIPIYQPVVYALFSVTMSLGVISKLASASTKRGNLLSSLIAAVILSALLLTVLPLCKLYASIPTLGNVDSPYLLAYAIITLLLSAVTGIVANAYPIVEHMRAIIPDDTLCCALIFTLALAFSMFGFDFAVKFGYLLVSVVGGLIFATACLRKNYFPTTDRYCKYNSRSSSAK